MYRADFIKLASSGCLGLIMATIFLESCASARYFGAEISGSHLVIPLDAFDPVQSGMRKGGRSIIAQNPRLRYPILVHRDENNEYRALLMRCTHQGTELQLFGDRLDCPAHGSTFSNRGQVLEGPADQDLRRFPVSINGGVLKVDLS